MCSQLSTIDEAGDLCQILACDVDQKEAGFDAMALRKMLIRTGHSRNQPAASAEDLKRTRLCFAADQINGCVRIPTLVLVPELFDSLHQFRRADASRRAGRSRHARTKHLDGTHVGEGVGGTDETFVSVGDHATSSNSSGPPPDAP